MSSILYLLGRLLVTVVSCYESFASYSECCSTELSSKLLRLEVVAGSFVRTVVKGELS